MLELRFVSRADEFEGDRFGLTDMLLVDPKLLSRMGSVIATYAVTKASAASKDARSYAASELLSLVGGLQQLLASSQKGFSQQDRTQICSAYGLLQSVIGEQSGNSDRIKEAVQAYRETLREWTRERAPRDWATAKSNLALVLARLGKRESGSRNLKEAIASYHEILLEYQEIPLGGADKQIAVKRAVTKSNLCIALTWLGQREASCARGRVSIRF